MKKRNRVTTIDPALICTNGDHLVLEIYDNDVRHRVRVVLGASCVEAIAGALWEWKRGKQMSLDRASSALRGGP